MHETPSGIRPPTAEINCFTHERPFIQQQAVLHRSFTETLGFFLFLIRIARQLIRQCSPCVSKSGSTPNARAHTLSVRGGKPTT